MNNKVRKISAEEHLGHRTCMFSATATYKNGAWNIHMYADWVESVDMTVVGNPIPVMAEMHSDYVTAINAKFGGEE